ncbi:hypothetical protein ALC53_06810 [Atta colombica]|uniref:Mariner Mos1 transposase n=1 Tax=Atta colombica TaxID=520822 RepID=A0A195BEP5_9HYME|nr:hypothetical protein ALC53_06810 [Atta colombica]
MPLFLNVSSPVSLPAAHADGETKRCNTGHLRLVLTLLGDEEPLLGRKAVVFEKPLMIENHGNDSKTRKTGNEKWIFYDNPKKKKYYVKPSILTSTPRPNIHGSKIKRILFMKPDDSISLKKYLETLKWDVLPHPSYSSDIAPSDYWLFRRMQQVTGSLL